MMPAELESVLRPVLERCDGALNGTYSALLFGSGARGEWAAARSDINLLLVLDDAGPGTLKALAPAFAALAEHSATPPLLLSRAEWRRAADAFPLEIADMRTAYRVLRGDDPMPEVQPNRADLRRALEREFRGKLLQLRRGYVTHAADEAALGWLATASVPTFVLLARVALVLLGRPVPATSAGVLEAVSAALGLETAPMQRVLARRGTTDWRCPEQDFLAYLATVEAAARAVDQLPTEE